ncbi:MAG: ethylbenzene dehydrogenase-related protein [Dehalococcoidia bacterium]
MKRLTRLFVTLMGFTLITAGLALAAEVELVAKKIDDPQAPKIDGKVDKIWDRARAKKVTVSEGPQGDVRISLKALYTDTDVYFLFRWPDNTKSLSRFYEFDGNEWKKAKGNEDYFALARNIANSIKDFPKKGCTVFCHKQDKQIFLRTNAPSERIDYWFHKPQRTNPVGQADDQYLTHELKKGKSSARRGDPKTAGGYKGNWDKKAKRPKYQFKAGVNPGPILLKTDAVEIKDYGKFKPGDRLPRDVLARAVGSRGDIQSGAVWEKRRWTLELKRARLTGDEEHDVQFTGSGPYYFGMSVWDNEDDEHHSHTGKNVVKFLMK